MKKILIIDDSATSRLLFKVYLPKDEEYEFHEAENEVETLEIVAKVIPDIVVLDYNMPDINGIDLAKKILELELNPLLVLLTADVQQNILDDANAIGFEAVIEKPINAEKITEIIKNIRH